MNINGFGIAYNRTDFSSDLRLQLKDELAKQRAVFECEGDETRGARFYNDETCLTVLESSVQEDVARAKPAESAAAALKWAASVDGWYLYEKEWE